MHDYDLWISHHHLFFVYNFVACYISEDVVASSLNHYLMGDSSHTTHVVGISKTLEVNSGFLVLGDLFHFIFDVIQAFVVELGEIVCIRFFVENET